MPGSGCGSRRVSGRRSLTATSSGAAKTRQASMVARQPKASSSRLPSSGAIIGATAMAVLT